MKYITMTLQCAHEISAKCLLLIHSSVCACNFCVPFDGLLAHVSTLVQKDASFFDPDNAAAVRERDRVTITAVEELVEYLDKSGQVGISMHDK